MKITDLHEEFCQYQLAIKNHKPKTIKGYRSSLNLFLQALTNIEDIEQVSFFDVQKFFVWGRTERGWTANTFVTYHKQLNVFFEWLVTTGVLETNPFLDIEKPRLEKRLPTRLTKQESMKLIDVASGIGETNFLRSRNQAIFSLFIYCGLRRGELLKLTCQDVDLLNMIICVRQGKGSKDRVVPIPNQLKMTLTRYLNERNLMQKSCSEFFVSSCKDCAFTKSGLRRLVDQIKEKSGLQFYVHMLRHTFATLMIEGGCDIYSLSKMLGHNDIKTTTIYLSASVEHLRSQMIKHPLNSMCQ